MIGVKIGRATRGWGARLCPLGCWRGGCGDGCPLHPPRHGGLCDMGCPTCWGKAGGLALGGPMGAPPRNPPAACGTPCRAVPPALRSCSAPPNSSPPASSWPLKKSLLCLDGPVQKSQIPWFLRVGKPPKRHKPPQFPAIWLIVPRATSSPQGPIPERTETSSSRSCQLGKAKLSQPCVLPPSPRSQFTVPCKTFKYSIFNYSIHK